ncbi:hypothetical protein Mlab_1029 [Methanocorpusculum labreanum Z]|uniref:Argininosuccinate synthase n=1 Tax=Methanocorpusculum labreanum (strain ATCC 43576 / DSM 4855 / Z) TaxID=410358 RepID=A2SS92_METLZ|nr:hypothetical protein [Methanocorpusculum labreanum]ABN07198.1 hypothetical protein Mlab_1029 [Methanocorpusculum labreanum Z]
MNVLNCTCRILFAILVICIFTGTVGAATTEITIEKYTADGSLLNTTTVDYQWMEANLPVVGDGNTHYYLQGPVFEGDIWDPTESVNIKDMGALKGTSVKDLCDMVGGASAGDTITFIASDGLKKTFPQKYIYSPAPAMGIIFLSWYSKDEGYVPEYYTGMRLMFTGDTSLNPQGYHVFGVADEKATMDEQDWYYYSGKYPTTTGLSVQNVETISIISSVPATTQPTTTATQSPSFGVVICVFGILGAVLLFRKV